ncbi:MAG: hypothetical protein ACI89Z_001461, partial [Porticoccus sp.]
VYCMLASPHLGYSADHLLSANGGGMALYAAAAIVLALEVNALFGKQGPMTTVKGVIISSLVLTAILVGALCLL